MQTTPTEKKAPTEIVIDERGPRCWDWRLAVTRDADGTLVVEAFRSVAYDGQIRKTTEDYDYPPAPVGRRSEYGLAPERVVSRYVLVTDQEPRESELVARVRDAMEDLAR